MAQAESAASSKWRVANTDPAVAARPAVPVRRLPWRPVVRLAALASLFLLAAATRRTSAFRVLVGEDGVYEWLQVGCMVAVAVLALRQARRRGRSTRRLVLAGVGVAALAVVGEELAWGTRLLDLSVEPVQSINLQHETTLHNLGFGLEASFLAMAVVSTALACWQVVRRRYELACWFAVPAVYGGLRILTAAGSYEVAKMSEVAELTFAVAALRLVSAVTRERSRP